MTSKLASIINYLISTGVFVFMIFFLKNKIQQNPSEKIGGFSIKTFLLLMYVGLAINVGLVLWQIFK